MRRIATAGRGLLPHSAGGNLPGYRPSVHSSAVALTRDIGNAGLHQGNLARKVRLGRVYVGSHGHSDEIISHFMQTSTHYGKVDGRMDIFVVDDSAIIREHIATMLGRIANIRITGQADDAPAAIEGIARNPPDVVVLDISLRTSNGMDVLRYVARECPATKVIILSNYSEPESRELFLNAGAYQFFDKSLEFDKIRDAVAKLANPAPAPQTRH